ncbi:hypothetical protein ADUPG1_007228, partial [Aduncisulcus paluster]
MPKKSHIISLYGSLKPSSRDKKSGNSQLASLLQQSQKHKVEVLYSCACPPPKQYKSSSRDIHLYRKPREYLDDSFSSTSEKSKSSFTLPSISHSLYSSSSSFAPSDREIDRILNGGEFTGRPKKFHDEQLTVRMEEERKWIEERRRVEENYQQQLEQEREKLEEERKKLEEARKRELS